MEFNPWEISGDVNYDKLIKEFGLSKMPKLPKVFDDNVLFRRNIIFAQRDFKRILEAYNNRKPFAMMTGLMPSGKFHLGHKMVADEFLFYQKLGAKVYVAVADIEAYLTRNPNMQELRKVAIEEYLTNYVALGLDLKKCEFYFQSQRSKDSKKANAYYSLQNKFANNTTFNEIKGVYGEISPQKMMASFLQISDMYHLQLDEFEGQIPTIVPVGADQDPHIRLARGVAKRYKGSNFVPISTTSHIFMPGLKGSKMSSSDPNSYIALTDSAKEVKKKINKFALSGGQDTVEKHRKLGGNPDIDTAFQMLKFGLEDDDKKLKESYLGYKAGDILSGEMKSIAIDKISSFIKQHEKRRERAKSKVEKFLK